MLFLLAAAFVGNDACRPCHAAIVDSYSRTPMARSSGRVESVPAARFTAAEKQYRIDGSRLFFDGGSVAMDFFIGSNAAGRSFLFQRDGYLFQLPVTWYSQKHRWDASPGYENDREVRLNRPIEPSCLWCHASGVRPVLGTQNRYGDPPFLQNGVGCERCHGPGGEHVRDPKTPMVNPAKLDAARRDAVCAQCHLTGEARIEKAGRRFAEFRAGDRLDDYVTYYVWDSARQDLKATSHVEKLALSACKRASGEKLWCGSCHEPHTNSDHTQTACLSCHTTAHRQQERCATCHMPRTRVVDGGHGVLTDHSIPRTARKATIQANRSLVPFIGTIDSRSLGLAYAEIGDRRALDLLRRSGATDVEVQLRLAVLESSVARYEAVLLLDPSRTVALVNLGTLHARQGKFREAASLWQRALKTNPGLEEAVQNLASIQDASDARQTLTTYLSLNPGSTSARTRLRELQ